MPARETPPQDPKALRARIEAMQSEQRAKTSGPGMKTSGASDAVAGSNAAMAMRAGGEFVAAILLGAAIGWGLDWLLHTKPLLTILFFLLGGVAGVFNVIRATSPKGAQIVRDSRLSEGGAEAKDVPRVRPRGGEREED